MHLIVQIRTIKIKINRVSAVPLSRYNETGLSNSMYGLTKEMPHLKYGRTADKDNRKNRVLLRWRQATFFLHLQMLSLYY